MVAVNSCQLSMIPRHMSEHFPGWCMNDVRINKFNQYQCMCGTTFNDQDTCENHIQNSDAICMELALKRKSRECDICDIQFNGSGELKRHLKTKGHIEKASGKYVDIPLFCKVCNIKCASKALMEVHLQTKKHLSRLEGPPLELECKLCNIKCLSQKQMKIHIQTKKHIKNESHHCEM